MPIKRIVWAPGDQVVFTAGMDGNVYGWPIAKDARIDVLSANNRLSPPSNDPSIPVLPTHPLIS